MKAAPRDVRRSGRLRASALGLALTAVVALFTVAEWFTEQFVSDHSRVAGTAIELAIVTIGALAFRPLHSRAESLIEDAFTKRRREARAALLHLQKELTSFTNVQHLLRRVVETVDRHMSAAGSAVYLWRNAYAPEASTFDAPLEIVSLNDPLPVRLRSSSVPADPRALESSAAGDLAFPMVVRGELLGFLTLVPKNIAYEPDDVDALSALAEATGVALTTLDSELRLHEGARTNLPLAASSFVGREADLAAIASLVRRSRLVTLSGAGGVGKTRAALEAGTALLDEFSDGVWIAEFAALSDASLVPATIARALSLPQSPARAPLDTLLGYLKRKRLLLLLDNCEHVIDEVRAVTAALLRGCQDVRILATSREPLHIAGEERYRMPSLPLPSAVSLFANRAVAANRHFALADHTAHVEEICRRLDGIPLAIELAAARANVLSPEHLARRLDERFRTLTAGDRSALPRHQTMRALIDWSYDLLPESERQLFRTLSIFAGSFTIQSCCDVYGDRATDELAMLDAISSLVDRSLVQAEPSEIGMRYRLLESMRQYAREKLRDAGEEDAAARGHAEASLALAERLDDAWEKTPDRAWLAQAEPELENFRAALVWAFGPRGDAGVGQRLAGALRWVWFMASAEGRRWVHIAQERVDRDTPGAVAARLDLTEAQLDVTLVQYKASLAPGERAQAAFDALGDALHAAEAKARLGNALVFLGRHSEGETLLRAALTEARACGARKTISVALAYLANARSLAGELGEARQLFADALSEARACGADRQAGYYAVNFAETEFRCGDAEAALRLAREALAILRAFRDTRMLAAVRANEALYLVALKRYDEARLSAREALAFARDTESTVVLTWALQHLAAIAAFRDGPDADGSERSRAARLLGYADARLAELEIEREATDEQEYAATRAMLRDAIGEPDLAKLSAEGATWDEDRVAAEALLI